MKNELQKIVNEILVLLEMSTSIAMTNKLNDLFARVNILIDKLEK